MNNSISISKLLASAMFLCAILSAVMASAELSTIYIVLFLVSISVGLAMEFNYLHFPSRVIINVTALVLLVLILLQIRMNFIIEPFMRVTLAITAVKMIEKKTARDYMQMILLSLMMLTCYSMVSINISFIFYCIVEGIICSLIMMLSAWYTKDPNAKVTFRNLLKLFSRLLFMFLLMIPLGLLMFATAPRLRTPFLETYSSRGANQLGFSDHVTLGDSSGIQRNTKLAFRAEVEKRPMTPYWRGIVMDSFNGRMWLPSTSNAGQIRYLPSKNMVKQEIYLEPGRHRYLFALDVPVEIVNANASLNANGVIFHRRQNANTRLQYSVVSAPANTIIVNSEDLFRRRSYLELPKNYIPRLRDETERITKGLNRSEKISAILNYLSPPNYEYSLTGLSDVDNALEHFLFVNKKGHCEFFASAMGVMLRMAGIPSRIVGGYKGGTYNEAGGYYSVFEASAHVWVEIWDPESTSWVRYDPTPYSPDGDWSLDYGFFEAFFDLMDYQWTKFVLNYDMGVQRDILQSMRNIITEIANLDVSSVYFLIIFGVIVVAIILGIYFVYKIVTANKSRVLLHNFILIMKRKGFSKHKSEGLREFSARLPSHEKIKAMPFIERFEEYYYKEKEFDKLTVKFLKESLRTLKK